MADKEKKEKKIIVDEDWKAEAQKEKAKLHAEEEQEKAPPKEEPAQGRGRGELPEGNFAALLSMLMIQTLAAMGMPLEEGQQPREPDLELARYHIDMLSTLEEKTKGNLTDQEKAVLSQTLNDLRMSFIRLSEASKQSKQQ